MFHPTPFNLNFKPLISCFNDELKLYQPNKLAVSISTSLPRRLVPRLVPPGAAPGAASTLSLTYCSSPVTPSISFRN